MPKEIFRKVALERLSSPEQLDQLITITTPVGWLALLAIGGLFAAAVFWGVYGSIPTQVEGSGIILKKEGMLSVQAQHSGEITTLNINVGDLVEQGQIIARIEQDELLKEIQMAQFELENLEISLQEKEKAEEETQRIQLQELAQRERNQHHYIKNLENQIKTLNELKGQKHKEKEGRERLAKEGIITESIVLEIEHEIVEMQQNIETLTLEIEEAKNQLQTIGLEKKQIESTEVIDELTNSQQVEKAKLEIRTLQKAFAENSQIVSPDRGKVLEIPLKEGDIVGAGTTIFLMERAGARTGLEVIVYFSPLTGKHVKKGMKAQVSPSIVKQEEYGFMEGTVAEVDKYPSTFSDIMKTLQNENLAQMLAADVAPIKVKVDLIVDSKTPSGYTWSSRNGPPITIDSGTISTVTVTAKEQPPITLVIPVLKKFLFGIGKNS